MRKEEKRWTFKAKPRKNSLQRRVGRSSREEGGKLGGSTESQEPPRSFQEREREEINHAKCGRSQERQGRQCPLGLNQQIRQDVGENGSQGVARAKVTSEQVTVRVGGGKVTRAKFRQLSEEKSVRGGQRGHSLSRFLKDCCGIV